MKTPSKGHRPRGKADTLTMGQVLAAATAANIAEGGWFHFPVEFLAGHIPAFPLSSCPADVRSAKGRRGMVTSAGLFRFEARFMSTPESSIRESVQLKGAGTPMSVVSVSAIQGRARYRCVWIDAFGGIQFADFDADKLERVPPGGPMPAQ